MAALGNEKLGQIGVHTPAALKLFDEHCDHRADHARALWTLIVLSEWLDWVAAETAYSGSVALPLAKLGV